MKDGISNGTLTEQCEFGISKTSIKVRLIIMVIGLILFGVVAWQVQSGNSKELDNLFRYFGYSLRSKVSEGFFVPVTYLGNAGVVISVIIAILLVPATRKSVGVPAALTGSIGFVIYRVLKLTFRRARPDSSMFLISQDGFSFPSGHSMNGIICYGIIIFLMFRSFGYNRNTKTIAGILGLLICAIGFSRIFVGVHYVTDVIGGWSLGISYTVAASLTIDLIFEKYLIKRNR